MKNISLIHSEYRHGRIEMHGTCDLKTSQNDIIKKFGNGDLGHKFIYFGNGTFVYVKYMDDELVYDEY